MRIAALVPFVLALSACGGTVVTDGGGGAGGASTQSSTPGDTSAPSSSSGDPVGSVVSSGVTASVASSSTGPDPIPCDSHDDCGPSLGDDVCVFSSGLCAQRCGAGSPPCPPGMQCVDCATGSCPGCEDCVGACLSP